MVKWKSLLVFLRGLCMGIGWGREKQREAIAFSWIMSSLNFLKQCFHNDCLIAFDCCFSISTMVKMF